MTISCNAGYTYTENTTRVCISGKWSGKVGKCEQGKKLLQYIRSNVFETEMHLGNLNENFVRRRPQNRR